jgi:hypothetical protein
MSSTAQPFPAAIAAITGTATGSKYQGAWTG